MRLRWLGEISDVVGLRFMDDSIENDSVSNSHLRTADLNDCHGDCLPQLNAPRARGKIRSSLTYIVRILVSSYWS